MGTEAFGYFPLFNLLHSGGPDIVASYPHREGAFVALKSILITESWHPIAQLSGQKHQTNP